MKIAATIRRLLGRSPKPTLIEVSQFWDGKIQGLAPKPWPSLPDFRHVPIAEQELTYFEASAILALDLDTINFALATGVLGSLFLADVQRFKKEQPMGLWETLRFEWKELAEEFDEQQARTIH